jgi:hypothetical protein
VSRNKERANATAPTENEWNEWAGKRMNEYDDTAVYLNGPDCHAVAQEMAPKI